MERVAGNPPQGGQPFGGERLGEDVRRTGSTSLASYGGGELQFHSAKQVQVSARARPLPSAVLPGLAPGQRAFWGILASAALLSLGAPFWFNMLKTLSNLRPVPAN